MEYNTSTNPTFEGAVRDTSGRGNDGIMYNGASYDATQKALVFDGTDDYINVRHLRNVEYGIYRMQYQFGLNRLLVPSPIGEPFSPWG